MIRALLFDLDGVLVDTDKMHFNALNQALLYFDLPIISEAEHLSMYKGLPTVQKLKLMCERSRIPGSLIGEIARYKQKLTKVQIPRSVTPDPEKIDALRKFSQKYKIAVCSNATTPSVNLLLESAQLSEYCDIVLGADDVTASKPSPEIYKKAIALLNLRPNECVIIEDSDVGQRAALQTGAHLHVTSSVQNTNYYSISASINEIDTPQLVIPAAGQGKRFLESGFIYPKPLIEVDGRPMIELVLENLSECGDPIIILQKKHCVQYDAQRNLSRLHRGIKIVTTEGLTEGAACTILQARHQLDPRRELIIANSDQFVDLDLQAFLQDARSKNVDGHILTFSASDPKWSYALLGPEGNVTKVAEKQVISSHATVGIYYFREARYFFECCEEMIRKNDRVNGEFYVCPTFNELISRGGIVKIMEIDKSRMHGLGTPEDLAQYLSHRRTASSIIEVDTNNSHIKQKEEFEKIAPPT